MPVDPKDPNGATRPSLWEKYKEDGQPDGLTTVAGAKSADAIEEMLNNPGKFSLDCAGAVMLIYYIAILRAMEKLDECNGRRKFNLLFPEIYLWGDGSSGPDTDGDGNMERNKTMFEKVPSDESGKTGDTFKIDNPGLDSSNPWHQENVIQLEDGEIGSGTPVHAPGIGSPVTVGEVVSKLKKKAPPDRRKDVKVDRGSRQRVNSKMVQKALGPKGS